MTMRTPRMVMLDSAIEVASTTRRLPSGSSSIASFWRSNGSAPYSGKTRSFAASTAGRLSPRRRSRRRSTPRISLSPGKKTRRSPDGAERSAVSTASHTSSSSSQGGAAAARSSGRELSCTTFTGKARPSDVSTGQPPRSLLTRGARSPPRVAEVTTRRRLGRSASCTSRHSASSVSASTLRSWNSSKMIAATDSRDGSSWMRRSKIPSVTTSKRVFRPATRSPRTLYPTRPPTRSPSRLAILKAAPRAATRRGSSTSIVWYSSRQDASRSKASGIAVVFPAPGGACKTRLGTSRSDSTIDGSSGVMGRSSSAKAPAMSCGQARFTCCNERR